ncbi:MAG: hypothetical protein GC190_03510 [Alphaproteobacteria bacterium]|nr:hypothetical protein [Alphaproteobacteria bacterium]
MFGNRGIWIVATVLVSLAAAIAFAFALWRPWAVQLTCTESSGLPHRFEYNGWFAAFGEATVVQASSNATAVATFGRRYMSVTFGDGIGNRRRYVVDRVSGFFSVFDPDAGGRALAVGVCTKDAQNSAVVDKGRIS